MRDVCFKVAMCKFVDWKAKIHVTITDVSGS